MAAFRSTNEQIKGQVHVEISMFLSMEKNKYEDTIFHHTCWYTWKNIFVLSCVV